MISGMPTMAATAYHGRPFDATDPYLSMNRYVRNVSILSGACLAVRRQLFLELGGFDPVNTPDGHSDIDFSYKIMRAGLRCVYTPYSLLTHVGNHSWDAKSKTYKADIFLLKRWGSYVSDDEFFSNSMRRVLDRDHSFRFRIYAGSINPNVTYEGPDILFVSHELSNTGAPRMVLEAAIAVKSDGGFPVVVSPKDGPLHAEFEKAQIAIIIDPSAESGHPLFQRFARNFDMVVVNTYTQGRLVEHLSKIPMLRTMWWLHEGQGIVGAVASLPREAIKRVSVVCVSEYSRGFIPRNVDARVLHNGLSDHSQALHEIEATKKFSFLVLGTVEFRKGQDLFVRAVSQLPATVKSGCDFVIAGRSGGEFDQFMIDLHRNLCGVPEIDYVGSLTHDEALQAIIKADVLVCCSRDEAFSLVAIEAASLGRPIIFSDHVGAHEILNEGCSLVFPSEDVAALRDRMLWAYDNQDLMKGMGRNARKVYEKNLTNGHFAKRFNKLVREEMQKE
jgi:glycosyltransferase involved in cell wall biosynthesis